MPENKHLIFVYGQFVKNVQKLRKKNIGHASQIVYTAKLGNILGIKM